MITVKKRAALVIAFMLVAGGSVIYGIGWADFGGWKTGAGAGVAGVALLPYLTPKNTFKSVRNLGSDFGGRVMDSLRTLVASGEIREFERRLNDWTKGADELDALNKRLEDEAKELNDAMKLALQRTGKEKIAAVASATVRELQNQLRQAYTASFGAPRWQ